MFPKHDSLITLIVVSLGYFIDMFDFYIFNVVRVKSLSELGLSGDALTHSGLLISSIGLAGLLIGAWASGLMGDRMGRKASLFISILLYSLGTFATAFVHDVEMFVSSLGLAGELGQGITLIAEKFSPRKRGPGIALFIIMGFVGVLAAALAAELLAWRAVYMIGGGAGLILLFTRMLLSESQMYKDMALTPVKRGGLWLILKHPQQRLYWCAATLMIVPAVFIPQIVFTLSPEIAKAMQIDGIVKANIALACGISGVIIGDMLAALISEVWQSRKKVALLFLLIGSAMLGAYLAVPFHSTQGYYIMCGFLGLTFGVWVIAAMWIAEHFPTTVRATATSTTLNFARGLAIPMNAAYAALAFMGAHYAVAMIGCVVFMVALVGWFALRETYGRALDKNHN